MAKLYVLVLLAMSLDMCSTRPSPKGKKGGCLPGKIVLDIHILAN